MTVCVLRNLVVALLLCVGSAACAQKDYSNFTLGAGFTPDPQTGTGHTGGSVDISGLGDECAGMIDDTPDHVITVTSTVNLRLYVNSDVDSTLVLVGPAGIFCDDDSHGNLDPEINATLTPGRYEVFVGHLGDKGRYRLTLTEGSASDGAAERYRDFTLGAGFTPDPQRGAGHSGGSAEASRFGAHCVGMIDTTADHMLTVTSRVNLRLYVNSGSDSTLVIAGPQGALCDDDSHGNLDAEINAWFAPGTYEIYVGEMGSEGSDYTLTITER
jgi:hypothetical protein